MEKTKLTAHQNERITEALCRMAADCMTPDDIKIARRALVTECEEVNLATRPDDLIPPIRSMTVTEAQGRTGLYGCSPDKTDHYQFD